MLAGVDSYFRKRGEPMTRHNAILLGLLLVGLSLHSSSAFSETQHFSTRSHDLCFGWKFFRGESEGASQATIDDSSWQDVDLPHDWSIEGPKEERNPGGQRVGFFTTGVGWYRKHFQLSPEDKTKQFFVEFDGVYENSQVWINGHSLGTRPYGYSSFQYDLTRHLKFGENNVLAVRVDNSRQPNSRWYTGSGIYRSVRLTVTDKLHVAHWGTSVATPQISPSQALVHVETLVQNENDNSLACTLVTRIVDPQGNVVVESGTTHELAANGNHRFEQQFRVQNPLLWSVDHPHMYSVQTLVQDNQDNRDDYETPFGIRQIQFDKDRGFVLNGRQVKLKGVCIHHDAGALGAAVPVRAWQRRLEILKSLGCNAIRASHNPPSPELLDLCDRMGFVVIDEAFDKWDAPYGRAVEQWRDRDLTDMICRDRNHPSVVMWSVGNELSNQGRPEFLEQLKHFVELTHKTDPTRPVTCALRPFKPKSRDENASQVTKIAKLVDVISCNYQEQWFEDYRKLYPEIIIIASESYPYYRGKGLNYKAFEPVNPWLEAAEHGYVVGTFYWTGIDYLGEAVAGWPYHGWNCSLIDTCGWIRPFANLQKSFWTEAPMVHIVVRDDSLDVPAPTKDHWGWPKMDSQWTLPQLDGKEVEIVTFTNCAAVELLVNGRSSGIKKLADFPDKMMTWTVPYQPGRIEARGLVDGDVAAKHELLTAGKAVQIQLTADRNKLLADGRDLSYVDVEVTDKQGVLVPSAAHEIRFHLQGPAKIVGVDNGDLTSMEPYQAQRRSAFYGRAQAIIQASRKPGVITLRAEAEGLTPAEVVIETERQ